jgi:hypothetical protein
MYKYQKQHDQVLFQERLNQFLHAIQSDNVSYYVIGTMNKHGHWWQFTIDSGAAADYS